VPAASKVQRRGVSLTPRLMLLHPRLILRLRLMLLRPRLILRLRLMLLRPRLILRLRPHLRLSLRPRLGLSRSGSRCKQDPELAMTVRPANCQLCSDADRRAGWQNCAGLQVTSTRHPHAKSPEYGGSWPFFWGGNRLPTLRGLQAGSVTQARSHVSAELRLAAGGGTRFRGAMLASFHRRRRAHGSDVS
jgi:hypothetical protein